MDIIKNLKDYPLTAQQRIFASYLRENVSSYSCVEKIRNPYHIQIHSAPQNDFVVYSTGEADPRLLLRKAV